MGRRLLDHELAFLISVYENNGDLHSALATIAEELDLDDAKSRREWMTERLAEEEGR